MNNINIIFFSVSFYPSHVSFRFPLALTQPWALSSDRLLMATHTCWQPSYDSSLPLSLSLSHCLYFLAWHITLESHLSSLSPSPSLWIFTRSPSLSHTHSEEPGACVREDKMCHGVVGCFMWMLFKCVLTHSAATVTLIAACAPANRPSWLATCSAEPRGKSERENYLACSCNYDSSVCAACVWFDFCWSDDDDDDFVLFGDDDGDDDALWLFTLMSSSLACFAEGWQLVFCKCVCMRELMRSTFLFK